MSMSWSPGTMHNHERILETRYAVQKEDWRQWDWGRPKKGKKRIRGKSCISCIRRELNTHSITINGFFHKRKYIFLLKKEHKITIILFIWTLLPFSLSMQAQSSVQYQKQPTKKIKITTKLLINKSIHP